MTALGICGALFVVALAWRARVERKFREGIDINEALRRQERKP